MIKQLLALSAMTISFVMTAFGEETKKPLKSWWELSEHQRERIQAAEEVNFMSEYRYKHSGKNDVPDKLDWGFSDNFGKKTSPISWLTTVKNQHLPVYCGSCWAQALTSTLSDRINIQFNNGEGVEVSIGPQMLVACSIDPDVRIRGCSGGDTLSGANFIKDNYLMDASCMPYTATNGTCTDPNKICYDQVGAVVEPNFNKLKKWSVMDVQSITEFFNQPNTTLTPQEQ